MKKIMILAMLFSFATTSTALAQAKNTEAQRINVTGLSDASKQKAPKKQLQTKDAKKDAEKREKVAQQRNASAQNRNASGIKDDKETVKRYRSIERVTKSEEELSLAEEMKTKAQDAYIELQQKHMNERESLKKKQAQERLAGVTDDLTARQDQEMKELLARQSSELDAANRDRERAVKQYNRALTEYEKARNERLKYE